jgi:hypothetical protein
MEILILVIFLSVLIIHHPQQAPEVDEKDEYIMMLVKKKDIDKQ